MLLLFNIVLFGFFQEATAGAVSSVVAQEGIVRKTQFPRLVIPLSIVLTGLFNLGLNLIVVFVFILACGVDPTWTWLLLPVILLRADRAAPRRLDAALGPLRALPRRRSSSGPSFATVLFYATPVIYPIEHPDHRGLPGAADGEPDRRRSSSRRASGSSTRPPRRRSTAAGGVLHLIPAALIFIGVCVLAWRVFNREAPRIAEAL